MTFTNIQTVPTHTGKIYFDERARLEWLCLGDYGKDKNIKANFLGLERKIDGVEHAPVDLASKMVVTISTQKGCPMRCDFCDVPKYGFHGNASAEEMLAMVRHALDDCGCASTKRLNVHFARMGEPTFNREVFITAEALLQFKGKSSSPRFAADTVHPVISTMLPKANKDLSAFIGDWCQLKNSTFHGGAGLQFSINTTDHEMRTRMFDNRSLSLPEISKLADALPSPAGRKYTLNFAVTRDTIINAEELDLLFDKSKFLAKITPIHQTSSALTSGYQVTTSYESYDVYRQFEEPLLACGWDVIVFVPSKEEDADRITCGNALLSDSAACKIKS